jgi:hypothetical protein
MIISVVFVEIALKKMNTLSFKKYFNSFCININIL